MNFPLGRFLLAGCMGALIAAMAIYLTPLKWITVIEPTIKDIDPKTFYADFKAHPQQYLFIDVRQAHEYKMAHAVGSINIPLIDLYDKRHTLPKNGKEIVIICTIGRSSGIAYSYLQHYGFFNIKRVDGGLQNWVLEGLPIEGTAVDLWISSDPSEQSSTQGVSNLAQTIERYACPSA